MGANVENLPCRIKIKVSMTLGGLHNKCSRTGDPSSCTMLTRRPATAINNIVHITKQYVYKVYAHLFNLKNTDFNFQAKIIIK